MRGRIIGISPGTRSIGIAILKEERLTEWKAKAFPAKWSKYKLQSLIEYVSQYIAEQGDVAIKIPDELPTSPQYIQLVATLNVLLERKGIRAMYYTLSDLKKHYCPGRVVNKNILSECIVSKYPELLPEYTREQTNRNHFYNKMFEAVAAARMYQTEMDNLPK